MKTSDNRVVKLLTKKQISKVFSIIKKYCYSRIQEIKKLKNKKAATASKNPNDQNTGSNNNYKLNNKLRGIRITVLLGFAVPIILLAVFGVVSYRKSSAAIVTTYEKSTTDTLNAVRDYLDLSIDSVTSTATEIVNSTDISDYYG
ncbi:MAG: hypothetical protein WBI07_14215, partial [Mobilitalea sp.]